VGLLSRFRTPAEQKKTVADLKRGACDIVIGTHRLLSKDIAIPKLGLIVIDEEQRFGVRHKEKLKRLSHLSDVLSLSATPIPRTLYQSLTGLRDMSVINTPPKDRLPVQTTLIKKSGPIIKEAIQRELLRNGQVFYLHNRVETIEEERERLEKLLPNVRIAVGHGQMPEDELEEVIKDFVEGKYDVLLCTMIVESGIDMPNVNTIIIADAQRFGLADLYQLRGRVGRADRQAYSYLVVPNALSLDSQARQRLRAIMENTALGSGYQIAMKDLEIRGAGNILGDKQSGHIAAVGFGLYCKLLNRAIQMVKEGKYIPKQDEENEEEEETVSKKKFDWREEFPSLSPVIDDVTLHLPLMGDLPENYIQSPVLRLDLFRRLSMVKTVKELEDLREELTDRFGNLPKSTETLLDLTEIKLRARERGIDTVELSGETLVVRRQGKIYNPFGKFPKIQTKDPKEMVFSILAFHSRIEPLPNFKG
ncbi:transcription-repair coupling factor, partial [bacterium]|nr:transcription-repair coupling factor [bacterium]